MKLLNDAVALVLRAEKANPAMLRVYAEAWEPQVIVFGERVLGRVVALDDERQRIARDPNLSEAGKTAAALAAGRRVWAEVSKELGDQIAVIDDRLAAVRGRMKAPVVDVSPAQLERLSASLTDFDQASIMGLYAVGSDPERRAIELLADGPRRPRRNVNGVIGWEPMIDADALAQAQRARAEQANPDLADQAHDWEAILGGLRSIEAALRITLGDAIASAEAERIDELAAK